MEKTNVKSTGKKSLTIVLSVLAVILVIMGGVTGLMLSDPNAEKQNSVIAPSNALAKNVLTAAVLGKECSVTPDELNGYLEYRRLLSSTSSRHGLSINRTVVSVREDQTADAYLPVEWGGKHFGVSVHFTPSFDSTKGQAVLHVQALKIGRLPVNPAWVFAYFKDAFSAGFSVNGTDICMDSSLFKFTYSGVSAELKLTGVRIEDNLFKIQAKTNLSIPILGITP